MITSHPKLLHLGFLFGASLLLSSSAFAQNLYVEYGNTIGEYNDSTDTAINPSLLSVTSAGYMGLSGNNLYIYTGSAVDSYNLTTATATGGFTPVATSSLFGGIAVSASTLYVQNNSGGSIGTYNAATGALISASFITGLTSPQGVLLSGNDLFVTKSTGVAEYNATSGAVINASFITGLSSPLSLAIDGSDMFVDFGGTVSTIAEYSISGSSATLVTSSFITGVAHANEMAVDGNDLYVALHFGATSPDDEIAVYNATNGSAVTDITGLGTGNLSGLVDSATPAPEPASATLLCLGAFGALTLRRRPRTAA